MPDAACSPCGSRSYSDGTHNTSVVLEVQEDTVSALPGLGLADNDSGVDLLAELGLALLDGGHTEAFCQRIISPKLTSLVIVSRIEVGI